MTLSLQPKILRFESIDSTNLEALRQARAGAPEGLCIVAREQTRGRGRLDRRWESPKDAGLYFSIVLRPTFELGRWPLITLMTAVAVSDALANTCDLRVDIKWPNDILCDDRKLAGILAETAETELGMAVIVGIGINLKGESFAPELGAVATSIEAVTGSTPNSDLLLDELIKTICAQYEALQQADGPKQLVREWCACSSYAFEREVRVTANQEVFEGITRGLESDGALKVETASGKVRLIRAGDVTGLRPVKKSDE